MTFAYLLAYLLAAALGLLSLYFASLAHKWKKRYQIQEFEHHQLDTQRSILINQSGENHSNLLNTLDESIFLIRADGTIEFANQRAQELFASTPITGRKIREVFMDSRVITPIQRCLQKRERVQKKIILPQQSSLLGDSETRGTNAWFIDAAVVEQNHKILARIIIRDETESYQTEQIRQDFVANASHELRTPLAIINGYMENLLDDDIIDNNKMARRFLTIMRKHTQRIEYIVNDMLVISKLESGDESLLKPEPCSLSHCANEVISRLESMISNKKACVEVDIQPSADLIFADPFYLDQILFNLIENAIKQNSTPDLKIIVSGKREAQHSVVSISDNGIGIPSADLSHIFRRFYRVEKHHSQQKVPGTGLGLSIVKRAMNAHGGNISVASTPGFQTKFTLQFPHQT